LIAATMLAGPGTGTGRPDRGFADAVPGRPHSTESLEQDHGPAGGAPEEGQNFMQRRELKGEIEFRHVSFAYPGRDDSVLDDVSFKIARVNGWR
jgi:ATP-binding cassette subfamily C protein LapB